MERLESSTQETAVHRINDTETQETTEPKRRRKSARRALEDICDRLESCINAPNQKPAKMIDALQKVADIRLKLLDYDTEKASDAAIAENETLKTQHESDIAEIARLKSQLETARSIRQTVDTTSDEPKLKQRVQELTTLIAFMASELPDAHTKACIAIRAILKYGTASRVLVDSMTLDFQFYGQGLNSNPSVEDLQNSLSRCTDPDGIPAVYARAALEVLHGVKVGKPVPRVRGTQSRDFASLATDEFNL